LKRINLNHKIRIEEDAIMKSTNFTQRRLTIGGAMMLSAFFLVGTPSLALADGQHHTVLSGAYAVRSLGYDQSCSHADTSASGAAGPGCPFSTSGVLVFDGKGNITGGTLFTNYGFNGATNGGGGCAYQSSASGTDTVNPDGTVIITLTAKVTSETIGGITNPCSGPAVGSSGTDVLAGAIAGNGAEVDFTAIGQNPPSTSVFTVDSGVLTRQRQQHCQQDNQGNQNQPGCD
jgi:hypothetical protein